MGRFVLGYSASLPHSRKRDTRVNLIWFTEMRTAIGLVFLSRSRCGDDWGARPASLWDGIYSRCTKRAAGSALR